MRLPAMQETQVQSLGWKIFWRRTWQPTPGFLPGELHGQRSLADYSPWIARVRHNLVTKPPPQTFSSLQAQPLFCSYNLVISRMSYKWNHTMYSLLSILTLHNGFEIHLLLKVSIVYSLLSLTIVPLHEYATICLVIHQLIVQLFPVLIYCG